MHYAKAKGILCVLASLSAAGIAGAATINVSSDITSSTTWTNNNTYNLVNQVYVKNGATLTIQPGTIIASTPTANGSGSLAITRGSKIMANGTCDNPIIFTSTADVATWTGGDPTTGTWREAANEWGNLTIMGRGYISEDAGGANSQTCNMNNVAAMEGLVADFAGDPDVLYGGGDDDDDSGSLQYVSIRYGGRVVGLANELNGLSLGGIGRETDIHHVEIMNNVDDGIEIWGGTVNLKHFSIWNVGDDSFDIDQGWRGKAQFGLIVQGWSLDAAQGSGVGDNAMEMDGAEDSYYQPVTTATIYNMTVIGQPVGGDHGTAWRDNARVQIRQSVFMDLGERLVSFDNIDGDGGDGYGVSGTLSWANTWTTAWNAVPGHANDCPAAAYQSQSAGNAPGQGFLAELTDSVFFRNQNAAAYTESNNRGVTVGGGSSAADSNFVIPGFAEADAPVKQSVRGPLVTKGGLTMFQVISLDPRAANEATSEDDGTAPNDGFFTPVGYVGAFSPTTHWLCGWTAADAFGFVKTPSGACEPCVPPPACPADIATPIDGVVDVFDLFVLLGNWGTNGTGAALAPDNSVVDVFDLFVLLGAWGDCP